METEIAAVAVLQRQWQERGLRDRENSARGRVRRVTAGIMRHDDVIRVIAAEKKKTDERLVIIAGVERRGTQTPQIEDRVQNSRGRQRGTSGLANKVRRVGEVIFICR